MFWYIDLEVSQHSFKVIYEIYKYNYKYIKGMLIPLSIDKLILQQQTATSIIKTCLSFLYQISK